MNETTEYPQSPEPNEYHYIAPAWLDDIAHSGSSKVSRRDMENDTGRDSRRAVHDGVCGRSRGEKK